MTEYELLDLVAAAMEFMYNSTTLYLTIVSGYLLVAYLVGEKLTRVQTIIISTLFMVGAGLQCWALVSQQVAMEEYLVAKSGIAPLNKYEESIASGDAGYIIATVMSFGALAALYFMWNIRHPKPR